MLKLNLQGSMRKTTIVLQLVDRSTMTPEGIVEDVMVSIDSWEYPANFLVLQPKAKLTRYPLILGRLCVLPLEDLVEETQAIPLVDLRVADLTSLQVKNVEFGPERTLKINSYLSTSQEKELCSLLRNHLDAFAWRYKEMKGVHPSICTHHIYIKEDCKPFRQPQRKMNPALKDIVKEELQKLLDVGFIYPISDSKWYLVLVPKKNGKWRIYVN
eukprot:PITA_06434